MRKGGSEGVPKCAYCGSRHLLHQCTYCGESFCHDHLLPETHSCPKLVRDWETYRKEREKRVAPPPIKERIPIEIGYEPESKARDIAKYVVGFIIVVVIIWALLYLLKVF